MVGCRRKIQLGEAASTPELWPSSQLSPLKSLHGSLNEQTIINPFLRAQRHSEATQAEQNKNRHKAAEERGIGGRVVRNGPRTVFR